MPAGAAEASRTLAAGATPDRDYRVALVIGNSDYPSGALANPRNDAAAMATSLKHLGFDVEIKLDATKADIDRLLRRFSGKAEKAGVAALFYAGHGIQVGGSNYLVPIDANPRNERDLKRDMVKMDDVIDDMGDARVKLVFFDACRDNPLSRSFSRGGSRGMAAPVEATGTLISFATKHGNTAADGDGKHSPYTSALLAALESPSGVEIEQLLRKVQQGVKLETKGQQEPWRYGSLDGDFYFRAADPVDTVKAQQEAVEKAIAESTRRANEQAAQQRAEFQKSIKAQQEASDRAVADAIRRGNEQAALDRAEMQKSMEKMLKEAYSVDGKDSGEWVFDGKPSLIGLPIDAALMFSPHWSGDDIGALQALNGSKCGRVWNCIYFPTILGSEKITVPAGTFDTRKVGLNVALGSGNALEIVAWYSIDRKRLIRQTVKGRGFIVQSPLNSIGETVELVAHRPGAS